MKSSLASMFCLILSAEVFAGHHESKKESVSSIADIKAVVDLYMEAFEKGDPVLFGSVMADDEEMVNYGTDLAERWVGKTDLMKSFREQISAFDVETIDISNQVVRVSRSGTTAWFSEIADWNIRIGEDTTTIKDIRITGVLEKQLDQWRIVQFHTSAPIAGQIVDY